jgi:MerR family transcriptional regulator, light-induced transcriptional regulator
VDDDLLTAGAVARLLGVAVTTLRSWHQRYGLGPSGHRPGHHRRYTHDDVTRLELMQRLVAEGVPPHEAARWAGRTSARPEPPVGSAAPSAADDRRDGGGHGLALGRVDPVARGLGRAALRLDALTVAQLIADEVAARGVVATWDEVLRPVLVAVGRRAGRTGELVEVEHLLSACTSDVFGAVPRPPRGVPVRILLACADEEQHSLPIEALAAALAADGVPARVLGARVPTGALVAAVRRTGPRAVLVWSHDRSTAAAGQLTALIGPGRRPAVIAAAGPGWDANALPPSVAVPTSLCDAVTLLASAVSV